MASGKVYKPVPYAIKTVTKIKCAYMLVTECIDKDKKKERRALHVI
jgi:hypothetical protein